MQYSRCVSHSLINVWQLLKRNKFFSSCQTSRGCSYVISNSLNCSISCFYLLSIIFTFPFHNQVGKKLHHSCFQSSEGQSRSFVLRGRWPASCSGGDHEQVKIPVKDRKGRAEFTWSKSCLPVVLVWMANSSSASIVVTRTLYWNIKSHSELQNYPRIS